jgi:uncharacterized Tic20 family protein/DNA-directed RNA polymerase subunit RPC12/RpoP
MPIAVVCPACKAKLKAPDALLGKTVKCPGCSKPILVKASASPAPGPASTPANKKPAKKPVPEVLDDEVVDEAAPLEDETEAPPRPTKKSRGADNGVGGEEELLSTPGGPSTDKERGSAMWIHLMPVVLGFCCGIGNLISLVMWISKRKESAFIDHHGKTWLNAMINLITVGFALGIVSSVVGFVAGFAGSTVAMLVNGLFSLTFLALGVYSLVMFIIAALKAKKGEWFEHRVLFKVLK